MKQSYTCTAKTWVLICFNHMFCMHVVDYISKETHTISSDLCQGQLEEPALSLICQSRVDKSVEVPSPMFSAHRDGWSCLATWLSPLIFISSFFLSVLQPMETNTFYAFDLSLFSSKWTWPCESLWLFTFQVRWCNSIYPDWKRHCCFQRLDRSRRPLESLKTLHAFNFSDQYMQKQKIAAQFHGHWGHNNGHLFH